LSDEHFERLRERPRDVQLDVTIGPDDEERHRRNGLRQMQQELECRLVGPVEILEDDGHGCERTGAVRKLAIRIEQESTLLLRGQLDWRRNIGEDAPQLRHQLGHFRRRLTQRVAECLRRDNARTRLKHLDERHVGRCPLALLAVPDETETTAVLRARQERLR
jgi:hypothetical protein